MSLSSTQPKPAGFAVRPLPLFLRAPNAVMSRFETPRLTPENVVKRAGRAAGVSASVPSHVETALEVLCRSIADEARLHWFGRMNMWYLLASGMTALLRVEQAFRDDPSLHETRLIPPVFVIGLPRSGTTYLHRLLSTCADSTGVTFFEHLYPVRPEKPYLERLDMFLRFEPWKMASKAYNMDAIHVVRPNLADECQFGMRMSARSVIYWTLGQCFGYLRWLLDQDLRETYQLYRKVLLLHQLRHPGRRFILKCPYHVAWLPALAETFPEATIVQTNRDPLSTVPSDIKLTLSLHALSTYHLDWRASAKANFQKDKIFAERAAQFFRSPQGGRVCHIDYQKLVSEPLGVIECIRKAMGAPLGGQDKALLETFIKNNRQHKHGKNRYSLEEFGLTRRRMEEAFSSYREAFISPL